MKPRMFLLTVVAATVACTGGNQPITPPTSPDAAPAADSIFTVFSRDRQIAERLLRDFQRQTGIEVRTRWGDPIDLAEQIIEDGTSSPADVYYGPLSDALGALSAAGRLARLSEDQLARVPPAYRSPDGTWAGTSGRAHVVFYNTDLVSEEELPDSILGFTDPAWRRRIAWDPTSRSLQDVVTQLRELEGEAAARAWLDGILANQPAVFDGAPPIIDAVAAGEIAEVGFGSHSYLGDLQSRGDVGNVAAKFYLGGAPGGLLNVAGVGILDSSDNPAEASAFVDFMLSQSSGRYFAERGFEIPLVAGVAPPAGEPTAGELTVPGLPVRAFETLDEARQLLAQAGITM
jgi:iron(III) transport system substrate-binding protein